MPWSRSIASSALVTPASVTTTSIAANAQTPPDTRHGQCWEAAIPVVENFQLQLKQGLPAGPGLAQLMQKTFNLKSSKSQIPDALVQACALTLADLNLTLAQFAGMIGVHAITLPKLPIP